MKAKKMRLGMRGRWFHFGTDCSRSQAARIPVQAM
jgi:hypothetical protein